MAHTETHAHKPTHAAHVDTDAQAAKASAEAAKHAAEVEAVLEKKDQAARKAAAKFVDTSDLAGVKDYVVLEHAAARFLLLATYTSRLRDLARGKAFTVSHDEIVKLEGGVAHAKAALDAFDDQ